MESRLILSAADMTAGAFDSMTRRGKEAYSTVEQAARSSADSAALAMAGALGGAFTIAGMTAFTRGVIESIDALNDVSDATGLAIEKVSALDEFARRTGATLDDVATVVLALQKALSRAGDDDSKGVAAALKAIGLEADELRKLDPADAIKEVADQLAKFDDGADKTRVMQTFFKDVKTAAPILKDLADQQELVGRVSQEQAEQVDRAVKAWAALTAAFHGFAVEATSGALPVLNAIFSEAQAAGSGVKGLDGGFSLLGETLRWIAILGGNVAFVFKGVGREIGGIAAQIAAVARGDFKGAFGIGGIGDMMTADAEKARADFDAWQDRMMAAKSATAAAGGEIEKLPLKFKAAGDSADSASRQVDKFKALMEKLKGLDIRAAGLDASYFDDLQTLFGGLQGGRFGKGEEALVKYRKAVEQLTKAQKFYTDELDSQEKAQEALLKLQESFSAMRDKELGALEDEALKLEIQVQQYGLTAAAIAKLSLRRAEDRLEQAKANLESEETVRRLDEEVKARRRIAEATASVEVAEANQKAAEKASQEWQRVSDDIGRGLTDAIFNGGKDGWELLRKTIEAQVIRAVVQPVVSGTVNGWMQSMGLGGGGSSGAGSLGNLFSTGSGLAGMSGGLSVYEGLAGYAQFGSMASSFTTGLSAAAGGADLSAAIAAYEAAGMGATAGSLSAGAGAASALGSGAGAVSSALSAVAAAAPYLAVGLIIAQSLGAFKGPTYHKGGSWSYDTEGNSQAANNSNTPDFNLGWGAYNTDRVSYYDDAMKAVSMGIASQLESSIKAYGGSPDAMRVVARFASDNDDWSEGAIRILDEAGNRIYDFTKRYTKDASEAMQQFGEDSARALLAGLQSADLNDIFDAMFDSLDPLTASLEDINALFAKATQVQSALALTTTAAMDAAKSASLSTYSAFLRLSDSLHDLATSGTATTDQLLAGMQASYDASVALFKSIADVQTSIASSYAGSIRNVQMSVLDNEGKYAYLDAEAAKYLDVLRGLTDPDQIQSYGDKLRQVLDQSYGLLSEDQQKTTSDEFVARYEDAQTLINERLAAAQQQAVDSQNALTDTIKQALIDGFSQASAALEQIGATIPESIAINVTVNNGGVSEVGVYSLDSGGGV